MKNYRIIILLLSMLFAFSNHNAIAQVLKIKDFKKAIKPVNKSSKFRFLNQNEYEISREMIFLSLDASYYASDTIFIVEIFEDYHANYFACYIYASSEDICIKFNMDVHLANGHVLYRSLNAEEIDCNQYCIMQYLKNGDIETILKKGEKVRSTPNAYVIITIATKDKKKQRYNLITYATNDFPCKEIDFRDGFPKDFLKWLNKYYWYDNMETPEIIEYHRKWLKLGKPQIEEGEDTTAKP